MKDIDEFIETYVGTGRYGKDREDTKDRAAAKLTDLLKKAFEAGRKIDPYESDINYINYEHYDFADYLKTKL